MVPDKERDMLGYANIAAQLRERPDCAISARTRARIEAPRWCFDDFLLVFP
jgi:hypothetical protein